MSERNGDRARFGRDRKRKILNRKRVREFRLALAQNVSAKKPSSPSPGK